METKEKTRPGPHLREHWSETAERLVAPSDEDLRIAREKLRLLADVRHLAAWTGDVDVINSLKSLIAGELHERGLDLDGGG